MSTEIKTDHTSSMTFFCKQPKQKCFQLLRTQNKNCVAPGVAPHVPFRTWSPAVVSPSLEQLKDKGRVSRNGRILQLEFEKQTVQLEYVESLEAITYEN